MSTQPSRPLRDLSLRDFNLASLYAVLVVLPTLILLTLLASKNADSFDPWIIPWALLVGVVELLPAPAWLGVDVSLGFVILTAVGISFDPSWAAIVALIGSTDPREFRGETTVLKALFNRCQVAIAVLLASLMFHHLASVDEELWIIVPATLVASLVDYLTNLSLVIGATSLMYRVPIATLARQLPRGREFLISYGGLSILGAVLAKLYSLPHVGFWSVLTVIAPLLLARQMFLRSHALEEAHQELQEREAILRELSNTMAEERADERLQIAGYLHDDLAQVLFRLSLQVDIARKLLDKGDVAELRNQLDKIRDSKQDTSNRIRALIRDLHRSPLGAKGLAEAIESFTDEVARNSGVFFHREIEDIELPAPIALLVFHITREGLMNALKHAQASDMWIRVREDDDDIVLQLEDNGRGFNTNLPGPEGHFGMAMMRDRAKVGGGSFEVESEVGKGTTITVRFPIALLVSGEQQSGSELGSASATGHASPGTTGTTSRAAEDSHDSVPA